MFDLVGFLVNQIKCTESLINICVVLLVNILFPPVPGPPVGILFPEVRTTSVRLIWQSPSQPNGIILG